MCYKVFRATTLHHDKNNTMKRMLALVLPLLLSANALATPPSTQSVDDLLKITSTDRMVEGSLAGIDSMMKGYLSHLLAGQSLPPDGAARMQKAADASRRKAMQSIGSQIDWKKMKPLFEQSYQQAFTQEEIDGMLAFYKTPAGLAMLQKMPAVQQETFALMHQKIDPLMQKIQMQINSDMQAAAAKEGKH